MAFHGNMQVAIAEARTLVEGGNRVAFFASSTGEVERVADILNEYGMPYQLGLEQFDSTPAYLAERAYMAGAVASIYLVKGLVRHGTAFQDSQLVVFGVGGPVRDLRNGGAARRLPSPPWPLFRRT